MKIYRIRSEYVSSWEEGAKEYIFQEDELQNTADIMDISAEKLQEQLEEITDLKLVYVAADCSGDSPVFLGEFEEYDPACDAAVDFLQSNPQPEVMEAESDASGEDDVPAVICGWQEDEIASIERFSDVKVLGFLIPVDLTVQACLQRGIEPELFVGYDIVLSDPALPPFQ